MGEVASNIETWLIVKRATEQVALRRIAAYYCLEQYRRTGVMVWLEAFVEAVGDGNAYESDFEVQTLGTSPALQKGCVGCWGRFDDSAFSVGEVQANGTIQLTRSHYCPNCRHRQGRRRWYDVLRDNDSIVGAPPIRVEVDNRRRWKGERVKSA